MWNNRLSLQVSTGDCHLSCNNYSPINIKTIRKLLTSHSFSDKEWTADTIRKFVRQNTDVYMGLAGCLREFDELARRFTLEFDTKNAPQLILEETKQVAANYAGKKVRH